MDAIGLIAPDLYSYEEAKAVVAGLEGEVILTLGLQEKGVAEAAKLIRQGVDVLISRGETAKAIKAAFPPVTVVPIKRTGFDIARALGRARRHPGRIAVVVFPYIVERIAAVCDALDISVTFYPVPRREDTAALVKKAMEDGAGVIIGAVTGGEAAKKLGMPYELVQSGMESLTEAVEEARAIMRVRQTDKAKMSLQHTVINAADQGIVAVDVTGTVTLLNAVAERYLGCGAQSAVGGPLAAVWPELDLTGVLTGKGGDTNLPVRSGGRTMVCSLSPVTVDGSVNGAVCTFHDAGRLQDMEAAVRRLYASGHTAAARFHDLQGVSPALLQAVATAKQYALSRDTVLLAGETGTGKELFAQSIHNHSHRSAGPFVAVNCAALPGNLLESELFGYVAGAFTGASNKGKAGLFELAHGGSIFLDEVTEMDPAIQAKLLRVLQEKKVMRLGSDQVTTIDVRVIASTNKNLTDLAVGNAFRRDLYYRLNVLLLSLPPLRERKEDIPLLCRHFLQQRASRKTQPPKLTAEALAILKGHPWPGNIRELQNVMARIAATSGDEVVRAQEARAMLDPGRAPGPASTAKPERAFAQDLAGRILRTLRETNGKRGPAAVKLGMSRSTLWRKMREMGI